MPQGALQCILMRGHKRQHRRLALPLTLAGSRMLPAHTRGHLPPDLGSVVTIVFFQVSELILHPPPHASYDFNGQGSWEELLHRKRRQHWQALQHKAVLPPAHCAAVEYSKPGHEHVYGVQVPRVVAMPCSQDNPCLCFE